MIDKNLYLLAARFHKRDSVMRLAWMGEMGRQWKTTVFGWLCVPANFDKSTMENESTGMFPRKQAETY